MLKTKKKKQKHVVDWKKYNIRHLLMHISNITSYNDAGLTCQVGYI